MFEYKIGDAVVYDDGLYNIVDYRGSVYMLSDHLVEPSYKLAYHHELTKLA